MSEIPGANFAACRELTETQLLAQCKWEAFRGSGPGGQKRNKTSNCMRLTHIPSGVHVIAGESRSQLENKTRAIRRLKMRFALDYRHAIDPRGWEPPVWMDQIRAAPAKDAAPGTGLRLQVSHRHPLYYQLVGLVLDLLDTRRGNVAHVAGLLGLSTSSVTRFLTEDPHLWETASRIRKAAGLSPLQARK